MRLVALCITLILGLSSQVSAQTVADTAPPIQQKVGDGRMMMTVFMRHDQSKNLKEINETIKRNGYFDQFPPKGVEVVSWYVAMGIGQIITLRFPPEKLREINVVLENTAWGPYRTDFYPTYDFKELAEQQKKMMQSAPK
jgi:hypothetical protein